MCKELKKLHFFFLVALTAKIHIYLIQNRRYTHKSVNYTQTKNSYNVLQADVGLKKKYME